MKHASLCRASLCALLIVALLCAAIVPAAAEGAIPQHIIDIIKTELGLDTLDIELQAYSTDPDIAAVVLRGSPPLLCVAKMRENGTWYVVKRSADQIFPMWYMPDKLDVGRLAWHDGGWLPHLTMVWNSTDVNTLRFVSAPSLDGWTFQLVEFEEPGMNWQIEQTGGEYIATRVRTLPGSTPPREVFLLPEFLISETELPSFALDGVPRTLEAAQEKFGGYLTRIYPDETTATFWPNYTQAPMPPSATQPPFPASTPNVGASGNALVGREITGFDSDRILAVFSGPGDWYLQGANGRASVSTNGRIIGYGIQNNFALISYEVSGGGWRFGYIWQGFLPQGHGLPVLQFASDACTPTVGVSLTDDPDHTRRELAWLPANSEMTFLAKYDAYWYYVEAIDASGTQMRGFVPWDLVGWVTSWPAPAGTPFPPGQENG